MLVARRLLNWRRCSLTKAAQLGLWRLKAACEELRNNKMFLKLLEAVLKTGNRMNVGINRGDAQAFKLDTLIKLVVVKGADGKTTLLHFVVQEIIRTEDARLNGGRQTSNLTLSDDVKCRRLGLQVVSVLSSDLSNVKKAAVMDYDVLSSDVSKLSKGISKIADVVQLNETTLWMSEAEASRGPNKSHAVPMAIQANTVPNTNAILTLPMSLTVRLGLSQTMGTADAQYDNTTKSNQ
ncbi:hypothetical protein ACFX13_017335 [Malus domestica]